MSTFVTSKGLQLNLTTTQDGYTYLQTDQHLKWQKSEFPDYTVVSRVMPLQNDMVVVEAQLVNKENKIVGNAHQSGPIEELGNVEQRAVGRLLDFQGLSLPYEVRNSRVTTTTQAPAKVAATPVTVGKFVIESGKYQGKDCSTIPRHELEDYVNFFATKDKIAPATQKVLNTIKSYLASV